MGASEDPDQKTNPPPPVPADVKRAVSQSAHDSSASAGLHATGKDAGEASTDGVVTKVKSEKECKSLCRTSRRLLDREEDRLLKTA